MSQPIVSAHTVTYNHESYNPHEIGCLVKQQTRAIFELVIEKNAPYTE